MLDICFFDSLTEADDLLWFLWFVRYHGCCDIFWNVDKNRSWSSCFCNLECSSDRIRKFFYILYNKVMLCNWNCDSGNINFLEAVFSKKAHSYVTCDRNDWNRVHVRCCKSCNDICCSRSACCKAHSDFPCRSRISVCCMRSSLLMRSQDMCKILFLFV